MDSLTLIIVGLVLMALPIVLFFVLVWLALFIFVWTHSYPWLKMVGKFAARPANLFSLLILYLLLWVELGALLSWLVSQLAAPDLLTIFLLLFIVALIFIVFVVFIIVWLGEVVWIARLIKWLYARWRGWTEGVYFSARLQLIKRKIKADMMKETAFRGNPGTGGKPGTGTRGKPTTGLKMGKKGMGFKEKLDALKSEFSAEVQRARSKLSRRK